jgi:hypothetical protein
VGKLTGASSCSMPLATGGHPGSDGDAQGGHRWNKHVEWVVLVCQGKMDAALQAFAVKDGLPEHTVATPPDGFPAASGSPVMPVGHLQDTAVHRR